ncbi:MAG: efflux transporter outer membrane subunit [Chromatiales bacterium]|jgi:multidrug efflux system outer membrane protein
MKILLSLAVALLLTAGCTFGPDYARPDIDMPASYRITTGQAAELANTAWWSLFDDPILDRMIETALRNNKDVRLAAERVLEFAARVDISRAGLYPQLGYQAAAGRSKSNVPGRGQSTDDNFLATLNVGWELDVWGRVQKATEAERARLLAAEEGRRSVILSLVSSVATSYIRLLNLDEQLRIARKTVYSRRETLRLFQLQFQGGVVSELEVSQVRSELELAKTLVPQIEREIALLENSLSILLGQNPGPITRSRNFNKLSLPPVPAGLPSELLERRPDIRAAEQQLVAANALIGVARTQYFPTISLTGLFGFVSDELSDLFDSSSDIWGYDAGLLGPIFDGGRIAGNIRATEAAQRQAVIAYQQAVQTAFREVDDALIQNRKAREIVTARKRQLDALRDYARLALLRYDEGQVSYIEVLDSERRLFDAELSYAINRGDVYIALVNVYKSMGGGWVTKAEQTANTIDGTKERSGEQSQSTGNQSPSAESLRKSPGN